MARKPIVKTPQYTPPEGPGAVAPSVRSRGIEKINAPRARDVRVPNMHVPLTGDAAILQGLKDVQKGIGVYAKQQYNVLERGRKAGVVEESLELGKRFTAIQDDLSSRKGSKALGMTEELIESREEIWEDFRGDREMDPQSELELKQKFATMFMQKVVWSQGREMGQAEQQVKDSKILALNKGITDGLQVPSNKYGKGLKVLEAIHEEVMRESLFIDPDMPPEQFEAESKLAYSKILGPWVDKLLVHDPSGGRKLWIGRSPYFKKHMLPLQWKAMNRKMEAAKPDALIDETIRYLMDTHRNPVTGVIDYLGAFKETNKKGFADRLEGDESGLASIKQKLLASYTATTNLVESRRLKVEGAEVSRIFNNPQNRFGPEEDAPFNYEAGIAEITIASRKGLISGSTASTIIARWRNPTWLPADDNRIYGWLADEIHEGRVPTDGQIIERIYGDADLKKFTSYVTKATTTNEHNQGTVDYVDVAEKTYDNVIASRSLSKRNQLRAFKQTYVDMVRQFGISNGMAKSDKRIFDEANRLLDRVFKTVEGEVIEREEMGMNPWTRFRSDEGYRFQFEDQPPKIAPTVDTSKAAPEVLEFIKDRYGTTTPSQEQIDLVTKYLEDQEGEE